MLEKLATNIIGGILSFTESFSQENKNFKRLNKLWIEQGTLFSWGLRVVYNEELFDKFYNGPYDRDLYHVKLVHIKDHDIWYCLSNRKRNTLNMEELSIFLADAVCMYVIQLQSNYSSKQIEFPQLQADEMTAQLVDPVSFRRALTKRIYRNAVGTEDTLHQDWYRRRIDQLRQLPNYKCSVCPPGEE